MLESARARGWRVKDRSTGRLVEIAGLEWGQGERMLVLLHANGFCAATWDEVAMTLAAKGRVVALDARGHGASSSPEEPEAYDWRNLVADAEQVLTALSAETGGRRIALCAGSSLGGVIAAALAAAAQPDALGGVVMLDPPILPDAWRRAVPDPDARRSSIAEQVRRRRSHWPSRAAAAASLRAKPLFARLTERAFECYVAGGLRDLDDGSVTLACRPEVEAAIFERTGSIDLFECAHRIAAPVHIVRADAGQFSADIYEALAAKFARSRVSTMTGGHLLPMEAPSGVAELLAREWDAARD